VIVDHERKVGGEPTGGEVSRLAPEGRVVHVDGVIFEADAVFAEMFGFTDPEEAIGTLLFDLVAPDARGALFLECLRRDGRTILVETITSPVEFEGRSARALSLREATEHRRPDIGLREANERFRLAFDGAPSGMALVGVDGRWLQVNPALCEIVGYPRHELLTKTLQDITHPDDLEAQLEFVRKVLAHEITSYSMEKRFLHADGAAVWVNLSVSLVRDDGGAPLYFVSQIEDVTARKRVEEAWLRESATVVLLERVAVAANEADGADHAFAVALEAVCAHTGWPIGHVYGLAPDGRAGLVPSGIWHFEVESGFQTLRAAIEATPLGRGVGLGGRVVETGTGVWIADLTAEAAARARLATDCGVKAGFAFPVLVGQEIVAVLEFFSVDTAEPDIELLGVMTNLGTQLGRVVERERLRDQQGELDSARERFVANAAHELRTPLATMRAVAGLLGTRRDDMTREEIEECFEMLERQGEGLEILVRDLLDLSLIEHGEAELDAQSVPVERWITQAIEAAPPPDGVTLHRAGCQGLVVRGNSSRLDRVLVNLLTNAYRYGGGSVSLTAHRRGSHALIAVEDDGDGVPEDLVGQLFEPFTRGRNSRQEGAGLGLAIARRMVEHLGGGLTYEPQEGGGARFVVRLPTSS
jgi:PAS domain S-box-containing protein